MRLSLTLPADFTQQADEQPKLLKQSVVRAKLVRLAQRGLNASQAARHVPYSQQVVQTIYRDPTFRREVLGRVEEALGNVDESFHIEEETLHSRLKSSADEAFRVLYDMLTDKETHPGYRMKIAQDILDRNDETMAGHQVVRKTFDVEQLKQAARTAREMDDTLPMKRRA